MERQNASQEDQPLQNGSAVSIQSIVETIILQLVFLIKFYYEML